MKSVSTALVDAQGLLESGVWERETIERLGITVKTVHHWGRTHAIPVITCFKHPMYCPARVQAHLLEEGTQKPLPYGHPAKDTTPRKIVEVDFKTPIRLQKPNFNALKNKIRKQKVSKK